jgi:hypothetical protein
VVFGESSGELKRWDQWKSVVLVKPEGVKAELDQEGKVTRQGRIGVWVTGIGGLGCADSFAGALTNAVQVV